MAARNVVRTCPYCGTRVELDKCAIVSTADAQVPAAGFGFDDDEPAARSRVLVPAKTVKTKGGGWFARLPSPLELADQSELPRRACTNCDNPFPLEMDECNARSVAVVGLNRSGKSYFIGSTLTAASKSDALAPFGVRRFTPLDETPRRLHNEYFLKLFRDAHTLDATATYAHVERPPLLFHVEMDDGSAFVLVIHDVSGEALMDRSLRARTAGFVARASAVIFTADPLDIYALAPSLPPDELDEVGVRDLDQAALLESVLRDMAAAGQARAPLALVLTKLDLLAALAEDLMKVSTDVAWKDRVRNRSAATRSLLGELGESKLVRLVLDHSGPSTFHAVSVLGTSEGRRQRGGRPSPIGVMDPLGTVLEQIRRVYSNDA